MNLINTALCSFGMSGRVFHAPFLATVPGFSFYAAWERSRSVVHDFYPGVRSYRTLEEMLGDEGVQLVVVNTPNYTHYDYVKKALRAGKHVIVEKPFTASVAEADELIALAKTEGRLLSVYHNRRYDADYKTVRKIVEEGVLGEIVEAEIHYDRYKEELSPKVHKETPGPGTGSLYDLGSHLVDGALQLFGMPQALFADIQAMRPVSQVDDYFELLLYYNRLRVRLKGTYQARETGPGFTVHGSKGSFIKSRADVQEAQLMAGQKPGGEGWGREPESEKGLLHTEKGGVIIREHVSSETGNYGDYYTALYEAIANGGPLPVTAEEGRNVIQIIEKAFQSNAEQRVVTL